MAAAKNRANTTLLKVAGSALMFLGSGMAFFGGFWWRNGIDDGGTFAWGLILFVAGMMTFVAARFRE